MTKEQQNTILTLRRAGKGYTFIANRLGVSKSTVATFCQRNLLGKNFATDGALVKNPRGFACKGTRAYRVTYKFMDSADGAAVASALEILGRSDSE